jgi:flavin reductase (DIM6/NTAB) family NADH-FMN oxidoreductase RutF
MIIKGRDLDKMESRYRANLINSITGIKPANLIGTRSKQEQDNLAIFSSVVHLGSNPAQIGIITRPQKPRVKDTYSNILETGFYTINHISKPFIKKAHYTSAKLTSKDSEFDFMNLKREFIDDFFAPFVKESQVKVGMKFLQNIDLPNGCNFIIGEVVIMKLSAELVNEKGHIDLSAYNVVGISGLNNYYTLEKLASFPYAKLDQMPDFHV